MYYSYVEIEYVATCFSPARTDLAVKLLSVFLMSHYKFWRYYLLMQCIIEINLLHVSLTPPTKYSVTLVESFPSDWCVISLLKTGALTSTRDRFLWVWRWKKSKTGICVTNCYCWPQILPNGGVQWLIVKPLTWLKIPIFGSDIWDPRWKRNSYSVSDSGYFGQNYFWI